MSIPLPTPPHRRQVLVLMNGTVVAGVSEPGEYAAGASMNTSHKLALHVQRSKSPVPNPGEWAVNLGGWLIPTVPMYPGLSLWTDWSPRKRLTWCVLIPAVPLAAILSHGLLASWGGPLTA